MNERDLVQRACQHKGLIPKPQSQVIRGGESEFYAFWPEGVGAQEFVQGMTLLGDQTLVRADGTRVELQETSLLSSEGYRLEIEPQGIRVQIGGKSGAFYAGVTLAQLLQQGGRHVASQVITDEPSFEYRGFMLDVARSFVPLAEILALVDTIAVHKLNRLHLHLVDDQAWRFEMTNEGKACQDPIDYTMLHRRGGLGACASGDNPGFDDPQLAASEVVGDNLKFAGIPSGRTGYYTQAELRYLVDYAARRQIQVIPEFEFPGHNHVVLHALPELVGKGSSAAGTPGRPEAWDSWQVGHSYLDFDLPETWRFIEHLLSQAANVFGRSRIHLGGDEAHELLKNYGPQKYQQILQRVVASARVHGFEQVTLWQEAAGIYLQENDYLQFWTDQPSAGGRDAIKRAANQGSFKIINSDAHYVYLDQKLKRDELLGLNWACPDGLPVEQCYRFDPLATFGPELAERVIGFEAPLWSETVRSIRDIFHLVFPRLTALAEVGWSNPKDRDWQEFKARLGTDAGIWS
ncbi:family 20 glycosylhydrolase [Boudabousia liubingyangii]|nr:family 20 glycosylhydrolase [Boudabousia liubingyangii]